MKSLFLTLSVSAFLYSCSKPIERVPVLQGTADIMPTTIPKTDDINPMPGIPPVSDCLTACSPPPPSQPVDKDKEMEMEKAALADLKGTWTVCEEFDKTDLEEPLPLSESITFTLGLDGTVRFLSEYFSEADCKKIYTQKEASESTAATLKSIDGDTTDPEYQAYVDDLTAYMNGLVGAAHVDLKYKAIQTAAGQGDFDLIDGEHSSYASYKIENDRLFMTTFCNADPEAEDDPVECASGRGITFDDVGMKRNK